MISPHAFDVQALFDAVDTRRRRERLSCRHGTPSRLTGIRIARFAIGMRLAMRITQALHRSAADFVYVAEW